MASMKSDTAASDLIGVMALIAIFVTATAIAGVALLSYPPGEAAPAMIARMTNEGGSVTIHHDGGDSLVRGHFKILVDGVDQTEEFSLDGASDWTSWKTGQVLAFNGELPKGAHIQIVGEGVDRTGSDWLLHEIGTAKPTTGPTTEPTTPAPVPLVASFTANVTSGPAPLAVQFTDISKGGPTEWSWMFGDGNTSDKQNPTHIYTAPGTYTATLTVTRDGASDTETKTGYITVYDGCSSPGLLGTYYPTRDFSGTPVQRIDQRLRFADAEAGRIYRYDSDEENWPSSTLGKTDQFSVVYEGYLLVPTDATYTFYLTSDDGSRLWIDAVDEGADPLIDNWGYHKPEEMNRSVHLSAGSHPIKVEMFEGNGAAVLYLEWSSPDFERKPVDSFCQSTVQVSADFTATPLNGTAPLEVQFTDVSTGGPTKWYWDFGDGGTSTVQNPGHTYVTAGNYTVTLTASNAYGNDTLTKPDYIRVTKSFIDFIIEENVFVYGTALQFGGSNVAGPGATIVITERLEYIDGGASIAVSNIYINGTVALYDASGASLGSKSDPGSIYVNGDLTIGSGGRNIYGDVYVNGNFDLTGATMHGDVYVNGDLNLEYGAGLADGAHIYYTGTFTHPKEMTKTILDRCIPRATVPGFTMPDQGIPSTKSSEWYTSRGYAPSGALVDNLKIFADSYSSEVWTHNATNIIIVARTGDITITSMGSNGVTGVFFAPNGKVTFDGGFLEGVVIARDGFFVTSGGTKVTFKNIEEYIGNSTDYPF